MRTAELRDGVHGRQSHCQGQRAGRILPADREVGWTLGMSPHVIYYNKLKVNIHSTESQSA